MLEKELQKINKIIDQKIVHGQDYMREARDHKLILKKIHYHTKKSFFSRILSNFSQTFFVQVTNFNFSIFLKYFSEFFGFNKQ